RAAARERRRRVHEPVGPFGQASRGGEIANLSPHLLDRLFELGLVERRDVERPDGVAVREQPPREVEAEKPGPAGDRPEHAVTILAQNRIGPARGRGVRWRRAAGGIIFPTRVGRARVPIYSYWSARSTFRRLARRAGATAATTPTIIATIANATRFRHGGWNSTSNCESARVTSTARKTPSGSPSAAPISAVMTLSCRTIRATWLRVIPTARNIPSSRVRSKTLSTSVFTIPNRLTITARASRT